MEIISTTTGNLSVTSHRHIIRIAKVCEYGNAKNVVDEVESLFRAVNITDMVRLMKPTVLEYAPENPRFRELDEKQTG